MTQKEFPQDLTANGISMENKKVLVAQSRRYLVATVAQAKEITELWLREIGLNKAVKMGLPEVDDRYHIWRVPLLGEANGVKAGEVVIDAYTTEVSVQKTTLPATIEARLLKKSAPRRTPSTAKRPYSLSPLRSTIGFGDAAELLDEMPAQSVDLIFTSPPYFNARPEYSEYEEYELYLWKMRQIIHRANRVLGEGRFFVMNTSPVLVRRSHRNEASRRIAVPFDLHRIFTEEGYDFVDDIIWVKPEGAGWATGRGRRFAADRNPMQYKAVPVTEYVLVYRKKSNLLIDWFIRNHPDRHAVSASKIADGYEKTNIWRINPATNSKHPAAFPQQLAEKVICYYSFKGDVVLDPFAGSGTVGAAACANGRRFVLFDNNPDYIELMKDAARTWPDCDADSLLYLNCEASPRLPSLFDSEAGEAHE